MAVIYRSAFHRRAARRLRDARSKSMQADPLTSTMYTRPCEAGRRRRAEASDQSGNHIGVRLLKAFVQQKPAVISMVLLVVMMMTTLLISHSHTAFLQIPAGWRELPTSLVYNLRQNVEAASRQVLFGVNWFLSEHRQD